MTQHPDFSRSPALFRAARRTGTIGAVLVVAAALVGSTLLPAAAVPAAAHPPVATGLATGPAPVVGSAPATAAAQRGVRVDVVSVSHPVAKPGDEVRIKAEVTNLTDAPVTDAVAQLTVDYEALTSRAEIAEWSAAKLQDPVRGTPVSKDVRRLSPGASTTVTFTYDPGAQTLLGFGGRRMAVAVSDATGRVGIARSFLMYDADGADRAPMNLSVLAPVTSPASDPTDPSSAEIELAQQTASGQRLDGVLEVAENSNLSLAIDPDLMGAAASSNDADLLDWSERMLAAAEATDTYTLPAHDPDLAALAHANVRSSGPRTFLSAPRNGNWKIPETWRTELTLPADGVAPDLETLDLAVSSGRPNVVVGSGGLAPEDSRTVTGRADVETPSGTARAAVTDELLTDALVDATDLSQTGQAASTQDTESQDTEVTTAATTTEGAQRLLADTAAVVSQAPSDPPSLSIVAPRSWTPDAEAAVSILKTLDKAGWVTTTTLDDLLAQDAQDVARVPLAKRHRSKAETAPSDVVALEYARDAILTFSSVAGDQHAKIWRPGVAGLSAPLSVAQRSDQELRKQVVEQVLRSTNAVTRRSITVVPRQDINFITDVGDIPVRVRNELKVDAAVTVVLRPDHPRLTVDGRTTATIPAGQERDVQVPVRAIGSGDVKVTAHVLTPTGAEISDDSNFQVRVRAGWEEVGTWIAAGLVALLFLAGIWRTVRRGRSPNRATSQDVEEAEEAAAVAAESPESTSTTSANSAAVAAE